MKDNLDKKFRQARDLFPHTSNVTFFNAAANGPYSIEVKKAVDDYVAGCTEANRSFDVDTLPIRQGCARLIGAAESQVGLGHSTSLGLNIAAFGLPLEKGDEVLVSDVEFPAIPYIWRAAADARGLKLTFLKSRDKCFDIEEFKRAIGPGTRVLAVSWIQFFNGYKNDLEELIEICRKNNIYSIIDGIQGVGTEPIDVPGLGIDIFSCGCHKWLLSPIGCAFYYISDRIRDSLTRPFASWLGVDWQGNFGDLLHFDRPWFDGARSFEMGYYASVNLTGMQQSLNLIESLGPENIKVHNYALIDRLAAFVDSHPYYRVTSCMEPAHRSSIFTFTCDKVEQLHRTLIKEKIFLALREKSIRVAVHLYNNEADIDRLTGVLEQFAE